MNIAPLETRAVLHIGAVLQAGASSSGGLIPIRHGSGTQRCPQEIPARQVPVLNYLMRCNLGRPAGGTGGSGSRSSAALTVAPAWPSLSGSNAMPAPFSLA